MKESSGEITMSVNPDERIVRVENKYNPKCGCSAVYLYGATLPEHAWRRVNLCVKHISGYNALCNKFMEARGEACTEVLK